MLTAVAGISARYSKFVFVLFCYLTNHLMTGPLGNSEFCFPRISIGSLSKSATAGATTAAVTEKVWGEYVSAVCEILAK